MNTFLRPSFACLASLLLSSALHAAAEAKWILNPPDLETTIWGSKGEDGAYSVHPTADGGCIVAGCTSATPKQGRDLAVSKLRADLSLDPAFGNGGTWSAGSTGTDQAIDAIEIRGKDGKPDGYLVVGYAEKGNGDFEGCGYHGGNDIVVARLTMEGKPDPAFGHNGIRMYGGSEDDQMIYHYSNFSEPGDRVVQTEGGFLVAGMTKSKNGDLKGIATVGWQESMDALIFKIDGHGEFVADFGDHGILRVGNKPCPNMGKRSPNDFIWSLKADAGGGFAGSGFHFGMGMPVAGGGMALSPGNNTGIGDNSSDSVSDHKMDGWLFRFDEHGKMRTSWGDHGIAYLGGSRQEKLYDSAATPDGGYVVCGRSASIDLEFTRTGKVDDFDEVLVKVGPDGKVDKSFGEHGVRFLGGALDQVSRVLMYQGDILALATSIAPRAELPLPPDYYQQVMVIRLSPKGEPLRYWSLGKEGEDWPVGMAIDAQGRVLIAGYHNGGKTHDSGEKKKAKGAGRGRDFMVMRFRPDLH